MTRVVWWRQLSIHSRTFCFLEQWTDHRSEGLVDHHLRHPLRQSNHLQHHNDIVTLSPNFCPALLKLTESCCQAEAKSQSSYHKTISNMKQSRSSLQLISPFTNEKLPYFIWWIAIRKWQHPQITNRHPPNQKSPTIDNKSPSTSCKSPLPSIWLLSSSARDTSFNSTEDWRVVSRWQTRVNWSDLGPET